MSRIRWMTPCLVVGLGAATTPTTAQVAEIQVLPAELNLEVGAQGTIVATLLDARGNPITTAAAVLLKPKEDVPNGPVNGGSGSGLGSIRIVIPRN